MRTIAFSLIFISALAIAQAPMMNNYATATDSGTLNAAVISLSNCSGAPPDGLRVQFLPANSNTTAPTLNVCGWGATTITRSGGSALSASDIAPGTPAVVIFNAGSSRWELQNPQTATGMVYPGAGVPNSTGSAWGTSFSVGTSNNDLVQLNGSAQLPAVSGALLTNLPYQSSTFLQNQISGAVTLGTSSFTPSSGTFPAVTTAIAGTWLVMASVDLQTTSATAAANFTCELFDGTTVLASGYILGPVVSSAAVKNWQMSLVGIKAEASTVTFTMRCTSTTASQLMEPAAGNNSGGNNASTITAVRIQ